MGQKMIRRQPQTVNISKTSYAFLKWSPLSVSKEQNLLTSWFYLLRATKTGRRQKEKKKKSNQLYTPFHQIHVTRRVWAKRLQQDWATWALVPAPGPTPSRPHQTLFSKASPFHSRMGSPPVHSRAGSRLLSLWIYNIPCFSCYCIILNSKQTPC